MARLKKRNRSRAAIKAKRAARQEEEPEEEASDPGSDADIDSDAGSEEALGKGLSGAGGVLVVGTYDGGLLGFSAESGQQLFGFASHIGCVKNVNCSAFGRLASGGTDQTVRLYDLSRGVEMGELQEHANSVTCVEFWGSTTLVTGDDDGQICVWRVHDWELLLKFRAHKVALSCFSVHPSGKIMASAGRDKNVRLWDLTRGTSASNVSLEGDTPEELLWSPSGDLISTLSQRELVVIRAKTGTKAEYRDPNSSGLTRISLSASLFLDDSNILVGDARGDMRVLAVSDASSTLVETHRFPEDRSRGRCKVLVRGAGSGGGQGGALADGWFAAGFSQGMVDVWSCAPSSKAKEPPSFKLLRSVETKIRLTCLTVWSGLTPAVEKAAVVPAKKAAVVPAKKVDPPAKAESKEVAVRDEGAKRKKKKARKAAAEA